MDIQISQECFLKRLCFPQRVFHGTLFEDQLVISSEVKMSLLGKLYLLLSFYLFLLAFIFSLPLNYICSLDSVRFAIHLFCTHCAWSLNSQTCHCLLLSCILSSLCFCVYFFHKVSLKSVTCITESVCNVIQLRTDI